MRSGVGEAADPLPTYEPKRCCGYVMLARRGEAGRSPALPGLADEMPPRPMRRCQWRWAGDHPTHQETFPSRNALVAPGCA